MMSAKQFLEKVKGCLVHPDKKLAETQRLLGTIPDARLANQDDKSTVPLALRLRMCPPKKGPSDA